MILTYKQFKELKDKLGDKAIILTDWGGQKHLIYQGIDIIANIHPDEQENQE